MMPPCPVGCIVEQTDKRQQGEGNPQRVVTKHRSSARTKSVRSYLLAGTHVNTSSPQQPATKASNATPKKKQGMNNNAAAHYGAPTHRFCESTVYISISWRSSSSCSWCGGGGSSGRGCAFTYALLASMSGRMFRGPTRLASTVAKCSGTDAAARRGAACGVWRVASGARKPRSGNA